MALSKKSAPTLSWLAADAPRELHEPLTVLGDEYPLVEGDDGSIELVFKRISKGGSLQMDGTTALISYDTVPQALRMVAAALGRAVRGDAVIKEDLPFRMMGFMYDASRNAVMKVDYVKKWLRCLALMGYNTGMLYTEDTYEIAGEPHFGYMRGAYTAAELREIDAYAARLGIEMIPCIQTLGHLAQVLKWWDYREVKDTNGVVLVGAEKTYALIEKMITHWKGVFRTSRIHIGMDEAWDLGRGQYMNKNGYKDEFDLFNEHLTRVVDICVKHGYRPMIWSDMYFAIGSPSRGYYDKECVIPDRVKEKIPRQVQLVYWDYYHEDKEFYLDYFKKHRGLGYEPVMASGVWTWSKFWHHHDLTVKRAGACIDASRAAGVKEIFFTLWGDDGEYCDFDSALSGLAWAAQRSYAQSVDDDILARTFGAVCGGSYKAHLKAAQICRELDPAVSLWDDPLMQLYLNHMAVNKKFNLAKEGAAYLSLARALEKDAGAPEIRHISTIAQAVGAKITLVDKVRKAYAKKNKTAIALLAKEAVKTAATVDATAASFRDMWLRHNKPNGLEVEQIRFAGQSARLRELARRLNEYAKGKAVSIPEFDLMREKPGLGHGGAKYSGAATASADGI